MSTTNDDDGLVGIFVKGAMFSFGALATQLLLRRWTDREPQVVVLEVPAGTRLAERPEYDALDDED